jgi:hypothetical protein
MIEATALFLLAKIAKTDSQWLVTLTLRHPPSLTSQIPVKSFRLAHLESGLFAWQLGRYHCVGCWRNFSDRGLCDNRLLSKTRNSIGSNTGRTYKYYYLRDCGPQVGNRELRVMTCTLSFSFILTEGTSLYEGVDAEASFDGRKLSCESIFLSLV